MLQPADDSRHYNYDNNCCKVKPFIDNAFNYTQCETKPVFSFRKQKVADVSAGSVHEGLASQH